MAGRRACTVRNAAPATGVGTAVRIAGAFRAGVVMALVGTVVGAVVGCGASDNLATAPLSDPYGELRLNVYGAVMSTVAPYDTLQLVAAPYTISNVPIVTSDQVTYSASDTTLAVSPTGLVTALHSANGTHYVIAKLRVATQNITRADTIPIQITDLATPPKLTTFSARTAPADSNTVHVVANTTVHSEGAITITAADANGTPIPSSALLLNFHSSDVGAATVSGFGGIGSIKGISPGTSAWIRTSTTFYGVTKQDSILIKVGYPLLSSIAFWMYGTGPLANTPYYQPTVTDIAAGGQVVFGQIICTGVGQFCSQFVFDVVFDDSTAAQAPTRTLVSGTLPAPASGNIQPMHPSVADSIAFATTSLATVYHISLPTTGGCANAARYLDCETIREFPRPGTYNFHSSLYNLSGKIIVH